MDVLDLSQSEPKWKISRPCLAELLLFLAALSMLSTIGF